MVTNREKLLKENQELKGALQDIRDIFRKYHDYNRPVSITDQVIEIEHVIQKL